MVECFGPPGSQCKRTSLCKTECELRVQACGPLLAPEMSGFSNGRLIWQAYTSSQMHRHAADRILADRERYAPLMQAVEWLLDEGHMSQEHLARLRAAWEAV